MIMNLIRPTTGEIKLFGQTKEALGTDLFRRIGAMIEYPGFYPHLTARENLLYNGKMIGIPDLKQIDQVLSLMGIADAAHKQVRQFSLGMRQRLGIARALLHEPEFLILDEPTNGLDPAGIREIRQLIRELSEHRRITILVSSHILPEIEQLATRVGIVHQGQLIEELTLDELANQGRQYIRLKTVNPHAASQVLEEKLGISRYHLSDGNVHHVFECLQEPQIINRVLIEQGIDVLEFTPHKETLEDRFMRMTGGDSA